MPIVTRVEELNDGYGSLASVMHQKYLIDNKCIEFSNSGQRGGRKYFLITAKALLECFNNILDNYEEFEEHNRYIEDNYRDLYSRYLTDRLFIALSTVQTKPLFVLISKTLHLLTRENTADFNENIVDYSRANLEVVINFLDRIVGTVAVDNAERVRGGYNKIYYGAPSTGKSYAIKKLTEASQETEIKIVFHADTQNSDFMGCLKPSTDGDDIKYTFQPGPFTNVLINALNDPGRMHYLVIEEINRASAAAVFGEVFQLLDRDANGRTEAGYEITPSDPMQAQYLNENVAGFNGKMYIPSNLTLLATMNSSDQAVMPMDTAFKRRWNFKYTPLDFDEACADGLLSIIKTIGAVPLSVSWQDFALEINKILSNEELPEDRHLGPFFVKPDELATDEKSNEALSGKVFMYLWDDILRHKQKSIVFDSRFKTNGALMSAFANGEPVFNQNLLNALEATSAPAPEAQAAEE